MATYKKKLKYAIFIIAYNAAETILHVYERIPKRIKDSAEEIFVFDDCSQDNTFEIINAYKKRKGVEKLKVFRNSINLGYGGNQKKGYRHAIDSGFDLIVMLHADAQYAPEMIYDLINVFNNNSDNMGMAYGSRIKGAPLKGGMPMYKFISNKILTACENFMLGSKLSEFHSGFRCYSCRALSDIPFELCSDGFSFDTEIIIMLLQRDYKIGEIAIPTKYGSEKCYVPLFNYGFSCLKAVIEYKLSQLGLIEFERYAIYKEEEKKKIYELKLLPFSSHSKINTLLKKSIIDKNKTYKILDLACGQGPVIYPDDYSVVLIGVDLSPSINSKYYSKIIKGNISDFNNIRNLKLGNFDFIVMADILEHLTNPEEVLFFYANLLKKNGKIIISIPNIANIYIRLSLLFGSFNYSNKGILDRTHIKFFTHRSFMYLIKRVGLEVKEVTYTPIPLELILPGLINLRGARTILSFINIVTGIWKTLLGYQFIFVVGKK